MPLFYIDSATLDQKFEVKFLTYEFRGYVLQGLIKIRNTYDEEETPIEMSFIARLHRDYDIQMEPYTENSLNPYKVECEVDKILQSRMYYDQLVKIIEKAFSIAYQQKLDDKKRRMTVCA